MRDRSSWTSLLIAVSLAMSSAAAATESSTPKQRAQIVEFSKQYEADILGSKAKDLATVLVKWWTEVPDLNVDWCANLLVDERPASKELAGAVTVQALLAAGVYVIEHSDQAVTKRSIWLAGMEGVVRAHHNLRARDPEMKDPFLDKLSELQQAGTLGEYVDAHSGSCR